MEHSGTLTHCGLAREIPERMGFANAARSLVAKFHMAPEVASAPHHGALWVDIQIRHAAAVGAEGPGSGRADLAELAVNPATKPGSSRRRLPPRA